MLNFFIKLLIFLTIMGWTGCEWMSYEEFEPEPYDGAFSWKEEVKNAAWGNRWDHAAAVFNKRIWVTGGYNPGIVKGDSYYEDVWNSPDGINWERVNAKAPWKGRRGHQLIQFDDGTGEALYLIGGFEVDEDTGFRQYTNDVWKSLDGITWTQVRPNVHVPVDSIFDWMPRMEHSCVVKKHAGEDHIFLIAGRTLQDSIDGRFANIYFNDVWRSRDAIHWEKLMNDDFGIRGDQAFTMDPMTQRLFIQGGTHGFVFDPAPGETHPIADWEYLWYSDDGEHWIAENDTSAMDQSLLWRSSHKMVFYQGAIWGLPGKTTSNEHYLFAKKEHYPIWRYEPETGWTVDSYGAAFDPRHGYEAVVFLEKVWILGGFTSNNGQSNDIWSGEIR